MRCIVLALAIFAFAAGAQAAPAWRVVVDSGVARLTYDQSGEDETTDLACAPGRGRIKATIFVDHAVADHTVGENWVDAHGRPAPWPTHVKFATPSGSADLPATTMPDEMSGGSEVDVTIPAATLSATAFARGGKVVFTAYGEMTHDPPIPPAKAAMLMAACGM
jgi:hypothetical protein